MMEASLPPPPVIRDVDILLMVDNSGSMAEEQAALGSQFERIFLALSTGDLNADGTPDFKPANSIRLGVVSSDMGAGQSGVTTCSEGRYGNDGILQNTGYGSGCEAMYPDSFLTFTSEGETSASQFANNARCVSTLGIGGCGFEQPLESVLKALTPSSASTRFSDDTLGHGDGENAGFLRDDSLLVVITVTDEDDCSTPESTELFSSGSVVYAGDLNLRCWAHPDALYPVSRYVDGLLALRPDPRQLIFTTISGVPVDLVSDPGSSNYDAIQADLRMQERPALSNPTRLTPSCTTPAGFAFPPRRLVEVARGLDEAGATGIVQSICQSDFTPAITPVIERIALSLGVIDD